MEHKTISEWLTLGLGPSVAAILITLLIALTIPLFLHLYIYRSSSSTSLPAFLLVGPSGAGKTALLTLFERGAPAKTYLSQTPLSVEITLPPTAKAASNEFRSTNDPSNQVETRFMLVDTPGHGKLRHFALNNVVNPLNLKGIVFMVDAATLSPGSAEHADGGLAESAEYLHDVLLALQKRYVNAKSRQRPEMPVLVAANKLDLFTALPTKLVKANLEAEITKLRNTRSKGLLDSGIGMDDDAASEQEPLGGGGEGKFDFGLMDEYNIPVEVIGGSVMGTDGSADVAQWWQWIAKRL